MVGVVEIIAEAHPDFDADEPRWQCVDIRAVKPFPKPVTLEAIKADPRLDGDGAGEELPPLGAAGQRRRMADDLRNRRLRWMIPLREPSLRRIDAALLQPGRRDKSALLPRQARRQAGARRPSGERSALRSPGRRLHSSLAYRCGTSDQAGALTSPRRPRRRRLRPRLPRFASAAEWTGPVASDADIDAMLPAISNWGRWGPDDQLGTLNFITPELRLAAIRSVRTGRTVSLARERPVTDATGIRKLTYRNKHYTDPQPDEAGTIDEVGMIYHGYVVTHLDALCHLFTPEGRDGMYNGYPVSLVTDAGAAKLGVEVMGATGIVGRGVLLDIAALKGGPLALGSIITRADLEAAEARQGVTVGEGDIVFVRNGRGRGEQLSA